MKFKTIVIAVFLCLLSFLQASATSAFMGGPTNHSGQWSLKLAWAEKLNDLWYVPFVEAGTSVEAGVEVVKLFSITETWTLGLIASGVVDWSKKPGTADTSPLTFVTGAAGIASTYNITKSFGLWVGVKYQFGLEENSYQGGVTAGLGGFFQLPM